jgi:competence protein ComEC
MPVWGLVMTTLGGAWLCLWQARWRLAGIPLIVCGLASIATVRTPDVLIAGDAKLIAVRDAGGLLQVSSPGTARLTRETWLRRAGQDDAEAWPKSGASADGRLVCDPQGCIYRVQDQIVALVRDASALAEDCRHAAIVVATIPARRICPSARVVVDRFALWRDGGHALWIDGDNVRVASVRAERGHRPWVAGLPKLRRERAIRSGE